MNRLLEFTGARSIRTDRCLSRPWRPLLRRLAVKSQAGPRTSAPRPQQRAQEVPCHGPIGIKHLPSAANVACVTRSRLRLKPGVCDHQLLERSIAGNWVGGNYKVIVETLAIHADHRPVDASALTASVSKGLAGGGYGDAQEERQRRYYSNTIPARSRFIF